MVSGFRLRAADEEPETWNLKQEFRKGLAKTSANSDLFSLLSVCSVENYPG
jgi:hypothetical protein